MNLQKTIVEPIEFKGVGLHNGIKANLCLKPAEANSGIKFKRTDIDNAKNIIANAENIASETEKQDESVIIIDSSISTEGDQLDGFTKVSRKRKERSSPGQKCPQQKSINVSKNKLQLSFVSIGGSYWNQHWLALWKTRKATNETI